jgi:hypothetical protein
MIYVYGKTTGKRHETVTHLPLPDYAKILHSFQFLRS